MKPHVVSVGGVWSGFDGRHAEVIFSGRTTGAIQAWKDVDSLVAPARQIETYMLCDDGSHVRLPFLGIAYVLLDRTGVIAIFSPGQYVKNDGSDYFPRPNNAAIFNADGTLRFQLRLPVGYVADRIGGFHGGAMLGKFADYMGVVVATHADAPPEWVYAVDPNNPELIETGQWTRW
jgi:hypothetical protein